MHPVELTLNSTIEALRDHNTLWRHILFAYYDETHIKKLKLAPISGASKKNIALFENGLHDHYMSDSMFVALINIARERYPTVLRSNRIARKYLSYLIQNIKKKIVIGCRGSWIKYCFKGSARGSFGHTTGVYEPDVHASCRANTEQLCNVKHRSTPGGG